MDKKQIAVCIAIVVVIVAGAAKLWDLLFVVALLAGMIWFYTWLFRAVLAYRKQRLIDRRGQGRNGF